jgi:Fe-S oxidoreductase
VPFGARPEDHGFNRASCSARSNLVLVELTESAWCCGSAGVYNLVQPEWRSACSTASFGTSNARGRRPWRLETGMPVAVD